MKTLTAMDFLSSYSDIIIVEGVTHWMPIPELPEESNDKE